MKNVNPLIMSLLIFSVIGLIAGGNVAQMATIPDAENSLITTDGRLFVSGSFNLYEITKETDGSFLSHR